MYVWTLAMLSCQIKQISVGAGTKTFYKLCKLMFCVFVPTSVI